MGDRLGSFKRGPCLKKTPTPAAYLLVVALAIIPALFLETPTTPQREPSSAVPTLYRTVKIGHDGKPGKFFVRTNFELHDAKANFAAIVESISGVQVTNEISHSLPERKSSRIRCEETITGSEGNRNWTQICELDREYNESALYLADYWQKSVCSESTRVVRCSFETRGECKKIEIPGLAQKLFKVDRYSANQTAFKMVENILVSSYIFVQLYGYGEPLVNHVHEAINDYAKTSEVDVLGDLRESAPQNDHASNVVYLREKF